MTQSQVIALAVAVGLAAGVFELVRRRRLSEEYSMLWLVATLGIAALGVWTNLLHVLTRAMGAMYDTSVVFFFGIMFSLAVSLALCVRLTHITRQTRRLAQEVAVLRAALDRTEFRPRA
jgi:hypothetical protein